MSASARELARLFEANRAFAREPDAISTTEHDPDVVTVSCCDARVPQDHIFGTEQGRNFTVASIGNSVLRRDAEGTPLLSGSVLYPFAATSPGSLVVLGHTDCGAVTAAWEQAARDASKLAPALQNELELLLPFVRRGLEILDREELSRDEQITRLVEYNVDRQVDALVEDVEDVPVAGAVFDLHGFYSGRRGTAYLTNYGGARTADALPGTLTEFFERKLSY